MRKALYMRLAGGNLKKNRQLYGPYLIACIVTVMMMCIMILLEGDRGLNTIEGGQSVAATLMFGCIVIAVFSLIILVYINSLLIKQRKKEFALYNVLGMEKRHISKVLFWESAYTAVISIGAGLIFGAVFSKLMRVSCRIFSKSALSDNLTEIPFGKLFNVEKGAAIFAKGNVIVLGTIYGTVFAGKKEDEERFIAALEFSAENLKIGKVKYRKEKKELFTLNKKQPKIAYVKAGKFTFSELDFTKELPEYQY